jgi:PAS domain S-box-containing protein
MTHVLIVEDHEESRTLLKMLLGANGYRVTAAGDGLEALIAARRDPPDAVISDVLMPKMDGFTLCRAWMEDAALKAIPFIFYSGHHVRPNDAQFGLALGAVRYLTKPLEAEVLLQELRAVLEQSSGPAPGPASPLDDITFRTLHESALTRTIDDKIAQLEAANCKLQESEARFRSMAEMSSDFYWESDAEHRVTQRTAGHDADAPWEFWASAQIGKRRWEVPYLSPDEAGWAAHRGVLDAHLPFRNFELSRTGADGNEYFRSISGDPVFDASGAFKGYRGVGTDITARKRAEEALRLSDQRLQEAVRASGIGIYDHDHDAGTIYWSPRQRENYGWGPDEPVTLERFVDQVYPEDRERIADAVRRAHDPGGDGRFDVEHRIVRRDGAIRWLTTRSQTFFQGEGKERRPVRTIGAVLDTTERKAAEFKIHRLTQLYAALSQCNEAIVRCASEDELFPQICRAAVKFGGMKMAWIGYFDPDTRKVRPAASFGDHADEYLEGIEISADADSAFGRGPTGTAIRENRPFWCQDFQNSPLTAPWRERGARFDWGASAALPLHRDGVPVGSLTLYAGAIGAFDEATRDLLVEMATDIDFALDNFARERARERAEIDLRAAEEQFRGLVEQPIAGVYIVQDGKFVYVNPRAAEIIGQGSADELVGSDPLQWVTEAERSRVAQNMQRVLEGETQSVAMDFASPRRDGVTIQIGGNAARATHKGRPAIIGILQDISEKKRADEQIRRYVEQLKSAFLSTVEVATTLSEMRDPYTAGHERRVGKIAAAIGAELGFDDQRIEGLRVAGFLHDIGKITIPAEILSKPAKLSPVEFNLIRGHAQASYDVLKDVEFPWPVAEVALQHHERMDGSGYPKGLKGEAIRIEARIMAVADVIEAMSSHRPYRPGLGIDKALAEIERGRNSAYDAEVADTCLRLFRERGYQLPE